MGGVSGFGSLHVFQSFSILSFFASYIDMVFQSNDYNVHLLWQAPPLTNQVLRISTLTSPLISGHAKIFLNHHLRRLPFPDSVVRTEIFVKDDSRHNLAVGHDASHGQAADLNEPRDGGDDLQHGSVVGKRVHVHAHEVQARCQLDAEFHTQAAQPSPALVIFHDDEGVSHWTTPGVFADRQDEGGHHLPVVLVDDGEAVPAFYFSAELRLVGVLVDAETLPLLSGAADHGEGFGELGVCHGVHQKDLGHPLTVCGGDREGGGDGGGELVVYLVQHGGLLLVSGVGVNLINQ